MEEMISLAFKNFGQSLSDWPFWMSAITVIVFARNRFSLQSASKEAFGTLDPPVPSRSFTTRFRYRMSEFIYATIYWIFYILLVSFGSIEQFQTFLQTVIGTLNIEGSGTKVASPAWAALFATAILPSVPGFKAFDERIRIFLSDFSSIPTKAHSLAADIHKSLLEKYSCEDAVAEIKKIINKVPQKEGPFASRRYGCFRKENQPFLDETYEKLSRVKFENNQPEDKETFDELLIRLCRYLSCALFLSFPDERAARKKLITEFKLDTLKLIGWQFRMQQIFISFILTFGVMAIIGVLFFIIFALAKQFEFTVPYFEKTGFEYGLKILLLLMGWAFYSSAMFILPLIFTAGIKLYEIDKKRFYRAENLDGHPLEDKIITGFIVFTGSFFLACLPLLMNIPFRENSLPGDREFINFILRTLSWGVPPAIFAVVFLYRSSKKPSKSSNSFNDYIADFLYHSLPVCCVSAILALISAPHVQDLGITSVEFTVLILIVSLILPGILGASNCKISRRPLHEQMTKKGESWSLSGEQTSAPTVREDASYDLESEKYISD